MRIEVLLKIEVVGKVKQTGESQKTCRKREQSEACFSYAERREDSTEGQACHNIKMMTRAQELA